MNASGQIVGWYDLATPDGGIYGDTAFIYSHGTYTTISPPGSISSMADSINNRGEIVGTFNDGVTYHGFLASAGPSATAHG